MSSLTVTKSIISSISAAEKDFKETFTVKPKKVASGLKEGSHNVYSYKRIKWTDYLTCLKETFDNIKYIIYTTSFSHNRPILIRSYTIYFFACILYIS